MTDQEEPPTTSVRPVAERRILHWREFHTNLQGTNSNWAPYQVRRISDDDGERFSVFQGGHRVASATLSIDRTFVKDLDVLPEHRGRGIATALYRHIEDVLGRSLTPSPVHQTPEGIGFWDSRGK